MLFLTSFFSLSLFLTSVVYLPVGTSTSSTTSSSSSSYDWTPVLAVIDDAITNQVFPGAVAAVRDATGELIFTAARGSFTYGVPPPSSNGTVPKDTVNESYFDMASCSKIIGPTTTAAYLWQEGYIELDMPVSDPSLLGPAYAVNNKDTVTIRNLLLHNAGYPPDPSPGYWETSFPCPNNNQTHPELDFSCTEFIFLSLLNQTLEYPPYTQYIYSDLSMITMMYVLGTVIDHHQWIQPSDLRNGCVYDMVHRPGLTKTCVYEAFWRLHIRPFLGMTSTGYILDTSLYGYAIPAWNDTTYRNEIIQGFVSDENSYANGGIQGHAGIFATLNDVTNFTAVWAYGYAPSLLHRNLSLPGNPKVSPLRSPLTHTGTSLLNRSTVTYWTTVANASFSSRALGWDTQASNDYYVDCGNLSTATFYHTGYTGTLMCVDPVRNWTTVLLTNRVYPNKTNNDDSVAIARQMFNNAVIQVLENPNRTDTRSLRQAVAAEQSGFYIGTAVSNEALTEDTNYSTILPYQYNIYVPENAGKWGPTNPYPNIYNFSQVKQIAEAATNAFSSLRYHNIIWHNQVPSYLCSQYEDPKTSSHCIATNWSAPEFQYFYDQRINITSRWITDYIANATLRLPPSIPPIYCIDVVNEAINTSTAKLWDDVFYKMIGPDYIARAFTLTKLIVPSSVVLVYNDYFLEGTHPAKTQAAYNLLQSFRQRQIPIDAVGFQMHYGLAPGNLPNATHGSLRYPSVVEKLGLVPKDSRYRYVDDDIHWSSLSTDDQLFLQRDPHHYKRVSYGGLPGLAASMALFASLNLTIQITEMDISILGTGNNNTQQLLQEQGNIYTEVITACALQPACTLLATWGFTDKYSWLGSNAMPLPFDTLYQRKDAFDSLYTVLNNWPR